MEPRGLSQKVRWALPHLNQSRFVANVEERRLVVLAISLIRAKSDVKNIEVYCSNMINIQREGSKIAQVVVLRSRHAVSTWPPIQLAEENNDTKSLTWFV